VQRERDVSAYIPVVGNRVVVLATPEIGFDEAMEQNRSPIVAYESGRMFKLPLDGSCAIQELLT
jgi:hypothetical protein